MYKLNFLNKSDFKKRIYFKKFERFLLLSKSCFVDRRIAFNSRLLLKVFLNKKHNYKKTSIVNIRNRCILTGRSRFIFKRFHLSRMSTKELLSNGFFSGFLRK